MRGFYTSTTRAHWKMVNADGGKSEYNGCDGRWTSCGPKGHEVVTADIRPQLEKIMGWAPGT